MNSRRFVRPILLSTCLAFAPTLTRAQDRLSTAAPETVGMSKRRLEEAAGLLQREVTAGAITAAALCVARRGKVVISKGYGRLRPAPNSTPVEPDSVFLVASITKPVTAAALLLLVERDHVKLDDPVKRYLPEFRGGEREQVQVRHLLSHVSGLPDMLPENTELRRSHAPLSAFVEGALETPLLYTPGTEFRYQSMGLLLAAEIVERQSGRRLRDFARDEIFAPLAMTHSALGLGSFKIAETVWCGTAPPPYSADEQRFGANSPYWRDMGHPWGGMHTTAPDLAILLQTLLNGGAYGGKRLWSAAMVEAMTKDQNGALDAPWGLGWGLARSTVWTFFGTRVSARTFGHSGATGTVAWADPERQLLCVILTNELVENGALLERVSDSVCDAVCDALEESDALENK